MLKRISSIKQIFGQGLTFLFFILVSAICYSQQAQPVMQIQTGNSDIITAIAISSDSRFVVTGARNRRVILWDLQTCKQMRAMSGHDGSITSVAISPNNKYVASGAEDKKMKLWDLGTGEELKTFDTHTGKIYSLVFSPDGRYLLSSAYDKTMRLWDIVTGENVKTYQGIGYGIRSAIYSPDGQFILAGSMDGTVDLFDVVSTKEIKVFSSKGAEVNVVAISPDGKYGASGGSGGMVILWDISTGKKFKTLKGHERSVTSLEFSPDGKEILSGSDDFSIKIWNVESGKNIQTLKKTGYYLDGRAKYLPDGKHFVFNKSKNISIVEIASETEVKSLKGITAEITSVDFSNNEKNIICGSNDATIKLWDISKGQEEYVLKDHLEGVVSVSYSPDNKFIASGAWDGNLKLWDVNSRKCKDLYNDPKINGVTSVAFSPDGQKIVASSFMNQPLHLFDVSNGGEIPVFSEINSFTHSVVYSPDGKYILSSGDMVLKLWDASNGRLVRTFSGHTNDVGAAAISPDGKFALSGSNDKTVRLWDIASGNEIRCFTNHKDPVVSVAFSHDGKTIASGDWSGDILIQDVSNGLVRKVLSGHLDWVNSVKFSKDNKYLLSGSSDGSTRLWNILTGDWTALVTSKYDSNWILYNNQGFWDASNNGGDLIAMVEGMKSWNIDQFALKFNRPDKILEKLPGADSVQIKHLQLLYHKRLKKIGIKVQQLSLGYQVPEVRILEAKQSERFIDVKFSISDQNYNLKNYNIFINDIPLFGAYGRDIIGKNKELNDHIELVSGKNKIEISCKNEKGVESYRALTYAYYNGSVKKDLYFLAFGVSKYQNPAYNLAYADKDANDLSKVIERYKGNGFENVYTKILTNEQVTPDAIKASKDFVKNAKPDDTFILFIAGHGMHDKDAEATYYYLTSNADINNLKGTAADFETIEDLLQGIPPRNKLFLMDACESGEIDDDNQGQMIAAATGAGINSRGFKVTTAQTQNPELRTAKRTYLYQKDRYIYNDLVRRSGAIVFSSSKGGELSYERSDIENGLFTEYIMKALTTTEADKDGNGIVSTDELREYVSTQVAKASGDLQHPTVDRDNIYQKFGFNLK